MNLYGPYGLSIRMIHTDCQFVWFKAVKNKDVWKGVFTVGMHDGMEECRLITTEGRDRLMTQQGREGGINGVWCRDTTRRGRRRHWRG